MIGSIYSMRFQQDRCSFYAHTVTVGHTGLLLCNNVVGPMSWVEDGSEDYIQPLGDQSRIQVMQESFNHTLIYDFLINYDHDFPIFIY